ncbi:MAG: hypothetical protein CMJ85_03275 [Planctomycetes bacterium]|nr:hypothetical protein [Planctomycetota bacterium]
MLCLLAAPACTPDDPLAGNNGPKAPALPDSYWTATAPADAKAVKDVRKNAKAGDTVVAVGRVKDYTASRAQFQLADMELIPCNLRPGDQCKTPWDYCCEAKEALLEGSIVVEFRDGGKLRKTDVVGFHGFDRLKEAVVRGRVERDTTGNVILVADALHIKP